MTTSEFVEGTVEARNDRGIRVLGEWRNKSRFQPVDLPPAGTRVRLGLDAKNFIVSVEVLEDDAPDASRVMPLPAPDLVSVRLEVLKLAAAYCARQSPEDDLTVLAVADLWLGWVLTGEHPFP